MEIYRLLKSYINKIKLKQTNIIILKKKKHLQQVRKKISHTQSCL
jgi:hypothetical protein